MPNKIKNSIIKSQTELLHTFPLNIEKESYFKIKGKVTSENYMFYKNDKGFMERIISNINKPIEYNTVLRLLFFSKSKTKVENYDRNPF